MVEYHEIGERFEYNGDVLEVMDYNEYVEGDVIEPCHLCYFYNRCNELSTNCNAGGREDRNYAYYKLVEQCKIKDMKDVDYHKVGERFEYEGVTLEVKEAVDISGISCDLCYLRQMCSEIRYSHQPPIRNCTQLSRKDRKSVYYVPVDDDYEHKTKQEETKDMEERKGDNEGVSGYEALPKKERVNHPDYYNRHPSGVECITIIRHHNFNIGSVIKYCWRNGLKTEAGMSDKDKQIEDLKKAIFHLNDEIKRLEEF